MELRLKRDIRLPDCTLGVLEVGAHKLYTIERPWIEHPDGGKCGMRFESCVTEGRYRLRPHVRPSGEKTWALTNAMLDCYYLPSEVPAAKIAACRTLVLIHAGNYVWDVNGCIAPGKRRSKRQFGWMVERSRDAMNEIRTVVGNALDLWLTIE